MQVVTAYHLGRLVRGRRATLGQTQAEVAANAGVSRRWLSDLENGKSTAEIGLILRTLDALGLSLDIRPEERTQAELDLDEHLARYLQTPLHQRTEESP